MQLYEDMGDARHKKSPPPSDLEEEVTEQFRQDVRDMLESNKVANRVRRLRPGADGYLISNRAELAKAVGADQNTIKHLLGGARPGTKTKHVARSVYVAPIRAALGLTADVSVSVRPDRAPTVRFFAHLPEREFKILETEIQRMTHGS